MRKSAFPRLVVGAAIVMVLASIAMLVATQIYSAYDVDRAARARTQHIVEKSVAEYRHDLAQKAIPQTYWDDAVVNLDRHFNRHWAIEYISTYFWETGGVEIAFVLDRDNRLIFFGDHGTGSAGPSSPAILAAARPLLTKIRAEEARRVPMPHPPLPDSMRFPSIVADSAVRLGDDIYLLSATVVQGDKYVVPAGSRAAVLFLGKKVDSKTVAWLAERFSLADPKLELGDPSLPEGRAAIHIRDSSNQTIAVLSWDPPKPGTAVLRKILPALLLFSLLLGALTWFVLRTGRRMARNLVDSEAAAHRLANHDPLTGLPNRSMLDRAFSERLAALADGGRPFAILCIDLDLFKAVNDSLGHLAGDELIRRVGDRLRRICREEDFLARFGGDEFVILQTNARRARSLRLAGRIVAALAEPVQLEAGRVMVGASIGIVVADSPAHNAEEYLRRADLALYRAKEAGRNTHTFFDAAMDNDVRSKQRVRTHLHDALLKGELELRYQPQVDRDGRMVGVEALARWTDDELGEVPAAEFVEVAEESGLIDSLGQFTIRQAFADSRHWPGLRLAVNISAVQLRQRSFPEWIKGVADEQGIDTRRVELEITERVLLGDDPHTHATLSKLRRYGFRIVLDDFGTGYSSLGYLQRYPIDKMKIDRSFVARIGQEPGAEAVVVAIVRLAKALGLDVIAEGVETDAQRLTLAVAGCSEVQGYLTGRPVRCERIVERVAIGSVTAAA